MQIIKELEREKSAVPQVVEHVAEAAAVEGPVEHKIVVALKYIKYVEQIRKPHHALSLVRFLDLRGLERRKNFSRNSYVYDKFLHFVKYFRPNSNNDSTANFW